MILIGGCDSLIFGGVVGVVALYPTTLVIFAVFSL